MRCTCFVRSRVYHSSWIVWCFSRSRNLNKNLPSRLPRRSHCSSSKWCFQSFFVLSQRLGNWFKLTSMFQRVWNYRLKLPTNLPCRNYCLLHDVISQIPFETAPPGFQNYCVWCPFVNPCHMESFVIDDRKRSWQFGKPGGMNREWERSLSWFQSPRNGLFIMNRAYVHHIISSYVFLFSEKHMRTEDKTRISNLCVW